MAKRKRGSGNGGGNGGQMDPLARFPPKVLLLFFDKTAFGWRESMSEYVEKSSSMDLISVPGDDSQKSTKSSDRARDTVCAGTWWFTALHDAGYTLRGDVRMVDFGVDQLGFLKGTFALLCKVRLIAGKGRKQDMGAWADIIEHGIHGGRGNLSLPVDLRSFLSLLRNYSRNHAALVRKHICHESEVEKSALVMKIHDRVQVLRVTNNNRYTQVVQKIANGRNWRAAALLNIHIQNVMRFSSRRDNPPDVTQFVIMFLTTPIGKRYVDTEEGLIGCRRNSQAHLEADCSTDSNGYEEAALFGACAALAVYYQRPNVKVGQKMPPTLARNVGLAISQAIENKGYLLEQAKAAAILAAKSTVNLPLSIPQTDLQQVQTAASNAAASVVSQPLSIPPAYPSEMFLPSDVEKMFQLIAPTLGTDLQGAMFSESETYSIDGAQKVVLLL